MLFDIPQFSNWTYIGQHRQLLVDQNNARDNLKRTNFDYTIGNNNKVLLKKNGKLHKTENKNIDPYVIVQVHMNDTVRIQHGTLSEQLNFWRLITFKENVITRYIPNRKIEILFMIYYKQK